LCWAVTKYAYETHSEKTTSRCRVLISHILSKGPVNRILSLRDFTNILIQNDLPLPAEQAEIVIKHFGDKLSGFGSIVRVDKDSDEISNIGARIGSKIGEEWRDIQAFITELEVQQFLRVSRHPVAGSKQLFTGLSLTLPGWNRYEELNRVTNSKSAFVAMKFKANDTDNYYFQDTLMPKYLVRSVKQAGFLLSNPLSTNPQAGNIHARLEVEIKKSRFIVAELSHNNNGAYWEAGFAKGLGKPVIYMYNKKIGKLERPHFDVGSDQVIFWDEEQPEHAAQSLKDIIRNTLFGEAKQTDDGD
jgi:hypothetical protein